MAARMPMMLMTTSSSINVKARHQGAFREADFFKLEEGVVDDRGEVKPSEREKREPSRALCTGGIGQYTREPNGWKKPARALRGFRITVTRGVHSCSSQAIGTILGG